MYRHPRSCMKHHAEMKGVGVEEGFRELCRADLLVGVEGSGRDEVEGSGRYSQGFDLKCQLLQQNLRRSVRNWSR